MTFKKTPSIWHSLTLFVAILAPRGVSPSGLDELKGSL
jgi:hypothetical protein